MTWLCWEGGSLFGRMSTGRFEITPTVREIIIPQLIIHGRGQDPEQLLALLPPVRFSRDVLPRAQLLLPVLSLARLLLAQRGNRFS